MSLLRYIPLFLPVLGVYAACMPFVNFNLPAPIELFTLPSMAVFYVTFNEIFLMAVTLVLFFEIMKAAAVTPGSSWIEHMLSTLVFIIFLVMFLIVPAAGNSTFAIVTLMSLIDVLAGWTIAYRSALRDFGMVGPHMHTQ